VLVDDLLRQTQQQEKEGKPVQLDLFADFNGIPEGVDKTDFYQHDQNWSNRMILGDSLQVMASLAEREGLCGKVQCIYFDPPYGIKFNSNFQWSTTSRDVKDGKADRSTTPLRKQGTALRGQPRPSFPVSSPTSHGSSVWKPCGTWLRSSRGRRRTFDKTDRREVRKSAVLAWVALRAFDGW
jgi:hypothetical protein